MIRKDRTEARLERRATEDGERERLWSPAGTGPRGGTEAVASGPREMDSGEIQRFLLRQDWGTLATVGGGRPYAVPVSYGFDGHHLYVASGPGRKRHNLEECAAVCLVITEVVDGGQWSSVVVSGEAHPVKDLAGKLHALNILRRQRVHGAPPSASDIARAARAMLFRIVPDEVTGRVRP